MEILIAALVIALALILAYIVFALLSNRMLKSLKAWHGMKGSEPGEFEKSVNEYWKQRAELSPRPAEVDRTKRIKSTQLFERYSLHLDTILAGERLYMEKYLGARPKVRLKAGYKRDAFYIQDRLTGMIIYLCGPVTRQSGAKFLREVLKHHRQLHPGTEP